MINSHALYRLSYGGLYNFLWVSPKIFVKIAQRAITTLFFFPLIISYINIKKRKKQITNQSVMKCNLKVRNLCDFGAEIFRFSILKPVNSVRYFNVRSHYRLSYGGKYSKTPQRVNAKCWRLPIFPGRRQPSIFGTTELNFCVRYGNRWTLSVINTNY